MSDSTKSHNRPETEIKARLRYARRRALLESLDILERRIEELFPVDANELMSTEYDWPSEAEPTAPTNVVKSRRSA